MKKIYSKRLIPSLAVLSIAPFVISPVAVLSSCSTQHYVKFNNDQHIKHSDVAFELNHSISFTYEVDQYYILNDAQSFIIIDDGEPIKLTPYHDPDKKKITIEKDLVTSYNITIVLVSKINGGHFTPQEVDEFDAFTTFTEVNFIPYENLTVEYSFKKRGYSLNPDASILTVGKDSRKLADWIFIEWLQPGKITISGDILTSTDVQLQLCAKKDAFTPTCTVSDPQKYINEVNIPQQCFVEEPITITYSLTDNGKMYDGYIDLNMSYVYLDQTTKKYLYQVVETQTDDKTFVIKSQYVTTNDMKFFFFTGLRKHKVEIVADSTYFEPFDTIWYQFRHTIQINYDFTETYYYDRELDFTNSKIKIGDHPEKSIADYDHPDERYLFIPADDVDGDITLTLISKKLNPILKNCLKLTSHDNDSKICLHKSNTEVNCEYSLDDGETWDELTESYVSVPQDQTIYLRGNNPTGWSNSNTPEDCAKFYTTTHSEDIAPEGSFTVSGDIMGLIDNGSAYIASEIPCDYCFNSLFASGVVLANTSITEIDKSIFSSINVLKPYCFTYMFRRASFTTVPFDLFDRFESLPDGTMGHMFMLCKSLTNAPLLSATELGPKCYEFLFTQCSALNIKESATKVDNAFFFCPHIAYTDDNSPVYQMFNACGDWGDGGQPTEGNWYYVD